MKFPPTLIITGFPIILSCHSHFDGGLVVFCIASDARPLSRNDFGVETKLNPPGIGRWGTYVSIHCPGLKANS